MSSIREKLLALPVIDPNVQGKLCTEEEFIAIAKPILPNFPDDVLVSWVYDNYQFFCDEHCYNIDYERISFRLCELTSEDITQIQDPGGYYEREMAFNVVSASSFSRLAKYMLGKGSWPCPILIIPDGATYIVLEGHMRYAYLRQMIDLGLTVKPSHAVWIVEETH